MELYKRLLIKILENHYITSDDMIIKKLKQNIDLSNEDKIHLEELIDRIL